MVLCAALHGHLELLQWLQQEGHSLNVTNEHGRTPLLCAARNGHLHIIKWLENQPDFSFHDKDNRDDGAMTLASMNNRLEVMQYLYQINPSCLHERNKDGHTPAIRAAMNDRLEALKCLHQMEAMRIAKNNKDKTTGNSIQKIAMNNLEAQNDRHGFNIVLSAAFRGHIKILEWLITQGCNLNCKTKDNGTALDLAARNVKFEMVKWLVTKQALIPTQQTIDCAKKSEEEGGDPALVNWLQNHMAQMQKNTQLTQPLTSSSSNSMSFGSNQRKQHLRNM